MEYLGVGDAGPLVEEGEVLVLVGVGGVGHGDGVAAAAVEGLLEVEHLLALLLLEALLEVEADLPVHGRLHGVLDSQAAALDKEQMLELRWHRHTLKRGHELRHLDLKSERMQVRLEVEKMEEGCRDGCFFRDLYKYHEGCHTKFADLVCHQ
jgi:hypothetical protein